MPHPEDQNLPPELASLEAKLGELTPSSGRLDRDRLMYELGKAQAASCQATTGLSWKWTLGLTLSSNVVVALVMFFAFYPGNVSVPPSQATKPAGTHQAADRGQLVEGIKADQPGRAIARLNLQELPSWYDEWKSSVADWFPASTPERPDPAMMAVKNLGEEFPAFASYARFQMLAAGRKTLPPPVILPQEEPPVLRFPQDRAAQINKYLDANWN